MAGIHNSLDALGKMLQADKHAVEAVMRQNVVKIVVDVLNDYPGHPTIVRSAARVLGAVGSSDEGVSILWKTVSVVFTVCSVCTLGLCHCIYIGACCPSVSKVSVPF